ncbi:MAG: hypothetical protein AABN95_23185 [Acidobacteriota bacterium]
MKHNFSHRLHLGKRKKGDTKKLAAQLAPLEEQNRLAAEQQARTTPSLRDGSGNHEVGAIVIDNTPGTLSKDIIEGQRERTFLGMEPVVVVILCGMLAFICFIAWQISQMPVE